MRISDQGQFTVNTTLEKLMPLITDPDFMARALPDVKDYKVEGPDRATLKMAVGVSHIRGVLPGALSPRSLRRARKAGGHR